MNQTTDSVIVGNVYPKYSTRNPIARWLMDRFIASVTNLYREASADSVLEVGCGEGHLAKILFESSKKTPGRFVVSDISVDQVSAELPSGIEVKKASIYDLPFEDGMFDLVVCCEVLEHLEFPCKALQEISRVTKGDALVSTPCEPLWRILNCIRGKYLMQLGNTPGHLQHFSRDQLHEMLSAHFFVVNEINTLPWSIALCRNKTTKSTIS